MGDCTAVVAPLRLTVTVPGSSTVPFTFSAPSQAGGTLTVTMPSGPIA
jgi:hypothetical protein